MLSSSSFSAVLHADGSSFMACLALVQWDTGTWWPCSTPFPRLFALLVIDHGLRPCACGVWGLRRMETGTVCCCYLARDELPALCQSLLVLAWHSQPSQVFTDSCDVVIFFCHCSAYRVGRPLIALCPKCHSSCNRVMGLLSWDYCSTCRMSF